MKVLIITPSYKPAYIYGGPIFSVAYLAENLSKQHEVLVLSTTANGNDELNVSTSVSQNFDGVSVLYFNRQTKDHSHLSLNLLRYLWNNGGNFDVIHIQSWWNLVALFSALICKIKKWKYVISPRGMLSPYTYNTSIFKKTIHLLIGNILLRSAKIHLTSVDEQKKVLALNSLYKTYVVPNYIDTNIPKYKKSEKDIFRMLFLARIHPKKGLDILLKSLRFLNFNFELTIVGDGDKEYIAELKNLIDPNTISGTIHWLGSKYKQEKDEIYANSDIMILPSYDENFANSVLESLMQGTPVVLSNNVGLANFIENNNLGWVYIGNEIQLAECLKTVFANKLERESIERRARNFILSEFDTNKLTQEYINIYRN